ncbi:hypothetical protein ACFW9O_13005 [Streptomyces sp. NPDC059499]|uniref:hypothetical protein n=1 Tax=Streptomyces sp. NPDC059499 TaxID=3346852 RepID=UPI00368C26BD
MSVHGSTRPRSSGRSSTGASSRRGPRTGVRAVLLLALVLGATTACSESSGGGDQKAREWKVGDCAGPAGGGAKDSFQSLDCDDPKATIKALAVTDGSFFAGAVECPAGTDEIISVKVAIGSGDASNGLPSKTICGRNLSGDHPGDAGAGGGQLVVGDCVDDTAKEVACGAGGSGASKVVALTKTAEECPAGADPMDLFPSPGRPYDTICTSKA